MPAAIAIPALISAGTSIFGAVKQHRAASQAQDAQVQATQDAYNLVNDATQQVNPQLTEGARTFGDAFINRAGQAGQDVVGATGRAGAGVTQAATTANGYLNPYMTAGGDALTKLGDLANAPGFTFSQDDPSYQWRLQQGQEALEASGAARGIRTSGGMLKELTNYAQGAASTEYQAAFNRFMDQRKTNASIYSNMAGMGLNASGQAGQNTMNAAQYAGNMDVRGQEYAGNAGMDAQRFASGLNFGALQQTAQNTMNTAHYGGDALMGAGDARAAGAVARGNAWANGVAGVGNAAAGAFTMRDLMRPKTVTPAGPSATNYAGYFNSAGVRA